MLEYDFLVIGGGAAGFFAAINVKSKRPELRVGIIEKQSKFLQKVKVSGGGRCNVTNGISDPTELASNYPRGANFLEEAFKIFNTQHTKQWFADRGVKLKTERDGRVFPISDSSQTIINCFLQAAKDIDLHLSTRVLGFSQNKKTWQVALDGGETIETKSLMVATGSDKRIWEALENLNFKINSQVPSLFTFKNPDPLLHALQGVSFSNAIVELIGLDLKQNGPLLITHWGLSGPAILRLSAWGAYLLKAKDYNFKIKVNWLADKNKTELEKELKQILLDNPKKNVLSLVSFGLTQRFWHFICEKSGITQFQKGAETGKKQIQKLLDNISECSFEVIGKSTFKEEFVTAGGIDLDQVNNINFSAINFENLYFGGEVLDIDAITGGFNFQAAWTAGWLVSEEVYKNNAC